MSTVEKHTDMGCQCQPCLEQRAQLRKQAKRSFLNPKFSFKYVYKSLLQLIFHQAVAVSRAWIVVLGWTLFAFLIYKTAGAKMENAVYDPFEILGLSAVSIYSTLVYVRRDE